jgi:prolyl oligopeptidase
MIKMRNILLSMLFFTMFGCNQKSFEYPETRKGDVVDNYFGTEVPDPYRWLEDDRSEETGEWVKAENALTFSYLEKIPFRNQIRNRLEELWNYSRMGLLSKEGGNYFYSYNDGLQNQNVIYIKKSLEDEGEVFMDPNSFSDDGKVALTNFSVSDDGKYVTYGISKGGSDWNEFFVKEVESGKLLNDHLKWIKFSTVSWAEDGFYYNRFDEPDEADQLKGVNTGSRICFHKLGTSQEEDKVIYNDPSNPGFSFRASISQDKHYLIIDCFESTTGNSIYLKDLRSKEKEIYPMVDNFENDFVYVGSVKDKLYFFTNYEASMYKVIEVDVNHPSPEHWKDVIPENKEQVMRACQFAGDYLIANYLHDASSVVEVYSVKGEKMNNIALPGIGTVSGISSSQSNEEVFYSFSSFNIPGEIYSYNSATNESTLFFKPKTKFESDKYVTSQIFYESKDGTKVPMFIVHKKGLKMDGKRPTLLYGYGGFNVTYTPSFSVRYTTWLENDGIFALANIRGGGEYGEDWHQAGTIFNKQNVFDDFIAAAEYLIANKYTSPKRLTALGGSNGGLLIGAVINQRPDLFAVAIPAVGVLDMLRYHKFTIGYYWATDYGTSDDPDQFEYIYKYSPVHNIKENIDYPAVLVTTADHDDRVVPAHSFKYIATLQEKYKGKNPVMIRIESDAGHSAGKPVSMQIDEYADMWSFAFYNMDFKPIIAAE